MNLEVVEQKQDSTEKNSNKDFSSKKIGRNEPCPCNSGKKYKHCHGSL
jgi:preprotein translocase subunit SecA